ncbi:MAG: GHMP kinase [Verrucomicrobiae bacterium]|nr:GHMP kinase [Verrucomicrobiae bacterium]
MIIQTRAHPRAGFIGNPSDGYFGKTISFTFRNFHAEVKLYETPELEILPSKRDHSSFVSIHALAEDVKTFGYYGGIRLLKATVKRFYDYCVENHVRLHNQNFTIRYQTTIPSHVGLAGSSAIITACMRALMAFYGVRIPKPVLAGLILSVENRELGIPAGLQDRVAQVYEGLVYMDFDREIMERQGYGNYEPLDLRLLPPVYVAWREDLSEGTEVFHNDIRGRFNRGEPAVVDAMKYWAGLTDRVRDALLRRDHAAVGPLLDAGFDKRREIYQISRGNIEMIEAARSVGASAQFCGSGGAIVGTYADEAMYAKLVAHLEPLGIRVLKPDYAAPQQETP